MDPNQTNPSSSTPATTGGMIPIAQLEQLLRLLQPNLDLSQTLAALATPPQIATVPFPTEPTTVPPSTTTATVSTLTIVEEEAYSGPTEILEEGAGEKDLADDVESGPSREMRDLPEKVHEVVVERAEVAPDVVETGTDLGRLEVDPDRVEADMAEIEEEIREGRGSAVEAATSGVEARVEAGLEADVVIVSDTEVGEIEALKRERKQREEAEQIYIASRRRKRFLMEESEEEREEGENITFRPIDEAPSRQPEPAREVESRAEVESLLEKKRKGKQVALPPKKKFKMAASTVRIEEPRAERVATLAHNSDDEETWRETRSKMREDPTVPVYPKVHCKIDHHSLA